MTTIKKVESDVPTGEKRAYTYNDERVESGSVETDDIEIVLSLENHDTPGKGKRQKTAAADDEELTTITLSTKNKGVPAIYKKASSAFMTREEAELVFDMVVESANWTAILKELNATGGISKTSTRSLKRHFTTVLKKQALSGYI